MAGSSTSQGTSSSQSTSGSYLPSYSEEPILEQLAQHTGALGDAVNNWAQGVWGNTQNLSDAAIGSYNNIATNAVGQAANDQNAANQGIGQYNNLVQDANSYNSTARQNFEAGQAEAQQTQAGQQAMNAHKQDLASYGIDPSSGQYANLDEANRLGTAASAAGAGTQAIQNTAATGRQLRNDAITQGTAYGNQAAQQQNIGLQGVAGASNTNLATANAGVNLQQAASPYYNTAMSLKYPPLGNQSQSSSQSQNTSSSVSSDPASGGGGGQQQKQPQSQGSNSSPSNGSGYNSSPSGNGGGGGGSNWSDAPFQSTGTGYVGAPGTYAPFDSYGLGNSSSGTFGSDSYYTPDLGSPGSMGDANNYTNGDFGGYTNGTDYGTSSDGSSGWGTGSLDLGAGGANYTPDSSLGGFSANDWGMATTGYDGGASSVSASDFTGGDTSGGDPSAGGDTSYEKGGLVHQQHMPRYARPMSSHHFNFKGGGDVTPQMSPSHGHTVDDVQANLNSGEFVIPRDVVAHKGHEFFQKLIAQSRQNNMKFAAQRQMRGPRG